VTGQNSEQVSSSMVGATRLKVLLRTVEEIDQELEAIALGVRGATRDVALDLSSIDRVDALLASLDGPQVRDDLVWSAPPPPDAPAPPSIPAPEASPVEAAPEVELETFVEEAPAAVTTLLSEPAAPLALNDEQEAFASISFSDVPVAVEEDVPRQLLDFEPEALQPEALATIVDMPDIVVEEAPPPPSAVATVIVTPEVEPPLVVLADLPLIDEPLFLSEPPALPVGDLEFGVALDLKQSAEAPAPELGAAVESMLIDEDAVVVEGASEAATPLAAASESSAPGAAEEQVVVDSDEVLVLEAPLAATGTLLGLAPTFRPSSLSPSKPSENDLGEIVFNLEPELEMAKSPLAAAAPASRPLLSSQPLRARDSLLGAPPSKRPPTKASEPPDNLELDLSDLMPGEARPPSLRPPPLLRQPPPPPQRSAPPPVPRASKPKVEAEEVVELDDQELEVMRASSRPPPVVDSKAPPPVPQRPGGQK
jgi:hypothetical protein